MANKQIVPYGADLNKKPNALALSVIPPCEIASVRPNQSYYAQVVRRLVIAPSPPRLCLEGKPHHQV
jgi:hypothetical protein